MKSKLVVSLLVLAVLLCQGIAFAETAKTAPVVTDVVAVAQDSVNGVKDEAVVAEESVNGVVKEAVVADQVVAPATEAVKKEEVKM